MRKLIFSFLFLLFLSACVQVETETPKIVFGAIAPLSGDCAEYGEVVRDGILIAVEEINAKGGINGKQVEVIFEDDKCTAKDATTAVQKLIDVDGVKVVFGGAASSETLGAAPIVEQAKVILISAISSSPDITNAGDFVFRTYPSDAYSASVAAEYAFKQGWKRAAVFSEQKDYSQGLRRIFKESFTKAGGEIVADEVYASDDADFRAQVLKIKDSKPDVVVVYPQTDVKGLALVKQLKENGVNQQLIGAEILVAKGSVEKDPALLEGLIGLELGLDDKNPKSSALFAKYRKEKGQEPPLSPVFMASAYDDVFLIADAVSEVGLDAEKIRDWLYNVKDWDGALGKVSIDKNGDPILKNFLVKQVQDGEVVVIK
ncbi:penicillin-binding protein activator [Candidatus Woesearchaeota archaeon]|nr:penicillin-binding protein activator [Candidatus Woesearchaeota archaeon]